MNRSLLFTILGASLLIVLLGGWWTSRPVVHPPGVLAPEAPKQVRLHQERPQQLRGHLLDPQATFALTARVLHTTRYRFDRGAGLAPYDFALGWGPMSDTAVLEHFTISQNNRFYFWRYDTLPIPKGDVIRNSSNMHLIPADDRIEGRLGRVREGDLVQLEGLLVNAIGDGGWRWNTSLSRTDAGNGACELFLVESVRVLTDV